MHITCKTHMHLNTHMCIWLEAKIIYLEMVSFCFMKILSKTKERSLFLADSSSLQKCKVGNAYFAFMSWGDQTCSAGAGGPSPSSGSCFSLSAFLQLSCMDCEILRVRNASDQLGEKGYLGLKEWHTWGHMDTRKTRGRFSW